MKLIRTRRFASLMTLATLGCSCANTSATQESFEQLRQTMVDQQLVSRGIADRRVLDALRNVPRHLFVPEEFRQRQPFDSILVTAASEEVPQPLIDQLRPGGRLVIPVGRQADSQMLQVLEKDLKGTITRRNTIPVRFVPLVKGQERRK